MRITEIQTNLKNGAHVQIESDKVLILGANGAGKSRITQAIELAISGEVSDVRGRASISKGVDLMTLAPGRVGPLTAEVAFDDGSFAAYTLQGSTVKTHGEDFRPPRWLPEKEVANAFPLRAVKEAFLSGPDKMRAFFVQHTGELSADAIYKLIPKELHGLYDIAKANTLLRDSGTKKLLAALEVAKKKANETAKKSDGKRELAFAIGSELPPCPDDLELQTAKENMQAAFAAYTKATAQAGEIERLTKEYELLTEIGGEIMQKEETAKAQLASAQAALEAAQQKVAELQAQQIESRDVQAARAMLDILQYMLDGETTQLPFLGIDVDPDLFVTTYNNLGELVAVDKESREAFADAKDDLTFAKNAVETLRDGLADLGREVEKMQHSETTLTGRLTVLLESEVDVESAQAAYDHAQTDYNTLKLAADQWKIAEKAAESTVETDQESEQWKQLVEVLEQAIKKSVDAGINDFSQRVQLHLPVNDIFQMRLRDGTREVCEFGFVKSDVLHTALSGAETARLLMAMADACRDNKLPWTGIIPDDRGWDADTLSSVLSVWEKSSSQVFFATPTRPSKVSSEWQIIEVK